MIEVYRSGPSRRGKNMRALSHETLGERLLRLSKVQGECRIWMGALRRGYGTVTLPGGSKGQTIPQCAHRAAYTTWIAPIPVGMDLDHLCRQRACINPWHLEIVTPAENNQRSNSPSALNARKTHCKRGHLLPVARNVEGRRVCRECRRPYERDWAKARRART